MRCEQLIELIEFCAKFEHWQWGHWQSYLHSKCIENEDGSLTIPRELVKKWAQQIYTPYCRLSHRERESDRTIALKFIRALVANGWDICKKEK